MDIKCVRVLRPYEKEAADSINIYIEEQTRIALNKNWGDEIDVLGRRRTKAIIQPLLEIDFDGYIARAGQKLIDDLYIEYGEEIFLS